MTTKINMLRGLTENGRCVDLNYAHIVSISDLGDGFYQFAMSNGDVHALKEHDIEVADKK